MVKVVSWVLEILTMIACMHKFHQRKLRIDLAMLLLIAFDITILYIINFYDMSFWLTTSVYVAVFIYSLYKFKSKISVTIVDCVFAIAILMFMQMIYYIPIMIIVRNPFRDVLIGFVLNSLCFLTIMLCGTKLHLEAITEYVKKRDGLTYFCVGCVVLYFFLNMYHLRTTYYWSGERLIEIMIWLGLLIVMWVQLQKNKKEKESKEIQLRQQEEYVKAFEQQLNKVRKKQHDFKNHLYALCGMSEEIQDDSELKNRQKEYSDFILDDSNYKRLVQGGNPVFTGFLNKKIEEMESSQIEFRYELAYIDFMGPFRVYEWIEVAGVLLDNAMEAVCEKPEEERKIRLEIWQNQQKIGLKVANVSRYISSEESAHFFEPSYSTKGVDRGIGLTKVKTLATENSGILSVTNVVRESCNWLEFEIIIPLSAG